MNPELAANLDRLLPAALEASSVAKVQDEFIAFLHQLTRLEHEEVLTALPDRPAFKSLPDTPQYTSAGTTSSRQAFADVMCYHAVISYVRHVAPYAIIAHLLRRLKHKPGMGIRKLAWMMSRRVRDGLFEELIRLDLSAGDQKHDIVAEFEKTLDVQFAIARPGFVDVALSALIMQLDFGNRNVKVHFEYHVLTRIRHKRRMDPNRLPKIQTAAQARFVVEEADRELFVYPDPNPDRAITHLVAVYNWYYRSKLRQAIQGRPIYMEIMSFFDEMIGTARVIKIGATYKPRWHTFVAPFMKSERFWHNLAGLNRDIPFEQTEAAARAAAYRRGALLGPAALMLPILAPVLIIIVIRVPGAVLSLVRWAGGRLLLATQYTYSTYRVFGAVAGTAKIARDAYAYYLNNAVTINQMIANGAEVALDIVGAETGMAPGSSPSDMAAGATQRIARVARKGIADVAADLTGGAQAREAEVELVEFVASSVDGKLYKVTAEITGFEQGKVKTKVKSFVPAVDDFAARKRVIFFSKPIQVDAIQDVRGLPPRIPLPAVPLATGASAGKLLDAPKMTQIAGKKVKSWHPDILVGTSKSQMRDASLGVIKATPDHPMAKVLVKGRFKNGGKKTQWEKDARFLQAAHVRSDKEGGKDILVLMSSHHNQRYSTDLERPGTPGAVILDEVFDIGGIAVHKQTARDLVEQGWLDASVLDGAKTIDLRNLDLGAKKVAQSKKAAAKAVPEPKTAANVGDRAIDSKATGSDKKMTRASRPVRSAATPPGNGLLASPARTTIGGHQVKSWHPTVLIGTSQDQMRSASLRIINADPAHPLKKKTLVDDAFLNGGTADDWKADARYLQAAHVRSKKAGGKDVIVLMSTHYNQLFSKDLEKGGTRGAIALDEVFDIGGIAMHKLTAYDLVKQGWLEKSVVDNAKTIDLRQLEL
jgi:hypothetical protein